MSILISGGSFIFPRVGFLLIILVLCFTGAGKVFTFRKQIIPILFVLLCIFGLTIFGHSGFDLSSFVIRFSVFIITVFAFNFFLDVPAEVFQRDLYVILRIAPYQAIATVIFIIITPFLFLHVELPNAAYNTIGMVFTYHTTIEDSTALSRPDGFFYEPGVYQIYLNIFLYLCLFVFKKKWEAVITILAVFLTQSTTGTLICIMIVGYYIVVEFVNKGPVILRIAKFFVGSLLMIPVVILTINNINEKLYGDFKGSSWTRQYDLLTGINIIISKPWTGIGFDYDQYRRVSGVLGYDGEFLNYDDTLINEGSITDRGNANGLVFLFYSIGIPLGLVFVIGMFRQAYFKHKFLFGMILFLAFMGESIIFTPFFLLLIFSGISRMFSKQIKIEEMDNLSIA